MTEAHEIAKYATRYFQARKPTGDKASTAPVNTNNAPNASDKKKHWPKKQKNKSQEKQPAKTSAASSQQKKRYHCNQCQTDDHWYYKCPKSHAAATAAPSEQDQVQVTPQQVTSHQVSKKKNASPKSIVTVQETKEEATGQQETQEKKKTSIFQPPIENKPTDPSCPACHSDARGRGNALTSAIGKVNGRKVQVLKDGGSVVNVVAKRLVHPNQYTSRKDTMVLMNGYICSHPVAIIKVETPYCKGKIEACVIRNPPYDLIVGKPTYEASERLTQQVMSAESLTPVPAAAVTTRQQEKDAKRPPKPLKISDVGEIIKDARLSQLQQEDVTIARLYNQATSHQYRSKGQYKSVIENGILYRKKKKGTFKQLIVPEVYRDIVLKLGHSATLAAHQGRTKTTRLISKLFYWPGMHDQIRRYVQSCDICQRTTDKGRVTKAPITPLPCMGEPFYRCAIDLVGPLKPASDAGHRYILVLTDMATKWPEAVPLKSITAEAVADALLDIFTRMGTPREVLSDRGSQFTSDMMREVYRLMNIKGLFTTPYHPQTNGACERLNGVLKKMLQRLSADQPRRWQKFVNPLLYAYRAVEHSSTGYSPFFLMFGREVRGPLHILKDAFLGDVPEDEEVRTAYQYVLEMRERLALTYKLAKEELIKAGEKSARYYGTRKLRKLKEGDQCLIMLPTDHNKLLAQWKGPYNVVEVIGPLNYKVDIKGQKKIFHINMLKRYHPSTVPAALACDDPQEDLSKKKKIWGPSIKEMKKERQSLLRAVKIYTRRPVETHERVAASAIKANHEPGQLQTVNCKRTQTYKDVLVDPSLSKHRRKAVFNICKGHANIFTDTPPPARVEPYHIKLIETEPVRSKPYSIPHHVKDKVKAEVRQMEEEGYLEVSTSPYASPMVIVHKPDKSIRICGDFRKVNTKIQFDAEPMADQRDIFARLHESRLFSKMDLTKGFYQVRLDEQSRPITAMATPLGLKQYTVVPFGLSISPAVFNRTLREILKGIPNVEVFMDDILVHSPNWEEHLITLEAVFARFEKYRISVKPDKCELGTRGLEFLGHWVGGGLQAPQEKNLLKIQDFPQPRSKKQVRSFLGLCQYYAEFIPEYTHLSHELVELTRKNAPTKINWTSQHEEAFVALKEALLSGPVLLLPSMKKTFYLQTDASATGLGAVLLQKNEDSKLQPVAYWSRKMHPAETRYATIERELLAIIEAVKKFQVYLYGKKFILQTDHQPLTYLKKAADTSKNGRLTRWTLFLQDFEFDIAYIPGRENLIADFLSRNEDATPVTPPLGVKPISTTSTVN